MGFVTKAIYLKINEQATEYPIGPIAFQSVLVLVIVLSSVLGLIATLRSSPLLVKIVGFLVLVFDGQTKKFKFRFSVRCFGFAWPDHGSGRSVLVSCAR